MAFLPIVRTWRAAAGDPARANVRTIMIARLTARFKSEDDRRRASIDAPSSRHSGGAYGGRRPSDFVGEAQARLVPVGHSQLALIRQCDVGLPKFWAAEANVGDHQIG